MPFSLLRSYRFLPLARLMLVLVLMSCLTGCSLTRLFKTGDPKKSLGTTLSRDPRSGQLTQAGLQAKVMSFADEYVLTLRQVMDEMIRSCLPPKQRATLNRSKVLLSATAMSIAAGRNPAANLLDMVVFISLERQVLEDYWISKFYADKAQVLLTAIRKLEKAVLGHGRGDTPAGAAGEPAHPHQRVAGGPPGAASVGERPAQRPGQPAGGVASG